MYHEELYNQAMNGDAIAYEELKAGAEVGNPDAQYMLSCLYGNMDSPFIMKNNMIIGQIL